MTQNIVDRYKRNKIARFAVYTQKFKKIQQICMALYFAKHIRFASIEKRSDFKCEGSLIHFHAHSNEVPDRMEYTHAPHAISISQVSVKEI